MSEDVSRKYQEKNYQSQIQGKIGPRELRKAFKQLGETVSEDEIMAMVRSKPHHIFFENFSFQIEQFDQDGDGKIDMNEFIDLMMNDEF